MYRRPWPIVIFAFTQIFVEPLLNLFVSARLSEMTPAEFLRTMTASGEWTGLFYILALPIVMGLSVYAMKRWSYGAFVACATWMLIRNFSLLETSQMNGTLALAFYLGNISFVSYFLIPMVREPYMNPRLRWWETAKRYVVDWGARIEREHESFACEMKDMSVGGAFLALPSRIPNGQTFRLRFCPQRDQILSIKAKVVFHRELPDGAYGHGVQFIEQTPALRHELRMLIRALRDSGCPVRFTSVTATQDFLQWIGRLVRSGKGLFPEYPSVEGELARQRVHEGELARQSVVEASAPKRTPGPDAAEEKGNRAA